MTMNTRRARSGLPMIAERASANFAAPVNLHFFLFLCSVELSAPASFEILLSISDKLSVASTDRQINATVLGVASAPLPRPRPTASIAIQVEPARAGVHKWQLESS